MLKRALSLTILIYLFCLPLLGQVADTVAANDENVTVVEATEEIETFTTADPEHSPRLAALYSAVIPGLGQFYNEKYWKIPLVYSLGAFAAFQIKRNHQDYMLFRNAYFNLVDGNPETTKEAQPFLDRGLTAESIDRRLQRFERDRDYWIILAGLFYVMNIVDATVDAHLREFNINENLSLNVEPTIQRSNFNRMHAGLSFSLRLK